MDLCHQNKKDHKQILNKMKTITYFEVCTAYTVSLSKEDKLKFNLSTHVITELYNRCLNLSIKGFEKYRIELYDKPDIYNLYPPDNASTIAYYERTFDFDRYFAQQKPERRKITLETLYEAIVVLCEKAGYDLAPFTAAYKRVKELNYENRYMVDKLKTSPNRKYKAGIQVEITEKVAEISVVVEGLPNFGNLVILKIAQTQPHSFFIQQLINKGKWVGSNTFIVSNKLGEINFVASLKDKSVEVQLLPKTKSEEELRKEFEGLVV